MKEVVISRAKVTLFLQMGLNGRLSLSYADLNDRVVNNNSVDRIGVIVENDETKLNPYFEEKAKKGEWYITSGNKWHEVLAFASLDKDYFTVGRDVSYIICEDYFLTNQEIVEICKRAKNVVLFTGNTNHAALENKISNLEVIGFEPFEVMMPIILAELKDKGYNNVICDLDGVLLEKLINIGLVDNIEYIVTPTLDINSEEASFEVEFPVGIKKDYLNLRWSSVNVLRDSYLKWNYEFLNSPYRTGKDAEKKRQFEDE